MLFAGRRSRWPARIRPRHLAGRAHIAGDDYSVADMASYPVLHKRQQINLDDFPNLRRWHVHSRASCHTIPDSEETVEIGLC
jgi:GST-like protein